MDHADIDDSVGCGFCCQVMSCAQRELTDRELIYNLIYYKIISVSSESCSKIYIKIHTQIIILYSRYYRTLCDFGTDLFKLIFFKAIRHWDPLFPAVVPKPTGNQLTLREWYDESHDISISFCTRVSCTWCLLIKSDVLSKY